MAGKSQGIRVQIYDQYYQLRSESDDSYTRELAQSVDVTMRTIAEKTKTYDSLRLAVLAALHFADECERIRQRNERLNELVAEKSLRLGKALDSAVQKAS
ncbi:MAG: cell division protein ZapA [Acidobacteria bacterium]|nr:cell division protein ZapA [Acidobacteriota bacterium]